MSESNEVEPEPNLERRTRPQFSANEKKRLLEEMDALPRGERGARLRRKIVVGPAIGQIKHARAFRQMLSWGLEQARKAWSLMCTAHNLLKLVTTPPEGRRPHDHESVRSRNIPVGYVLYPVTLTGS